MSGASGIAIATGGRSIVEMIGGVSAPKTATAASGDPASGVPASGGRFAELPDPHAAPTQIIETTSGTRMSPPAARHRVRDPAATPYDKRRRPYSSRDAARMRIISGAARS